MNPNTEWHDTCLCFPGGQAMVSRSHVCAVAILLVGDLAALVSRKRGILLLAGNLAAIEPWQHGILLAGDLAAIVPWQHGILSQAFWKHGHANPIVEVGGELHATVVEVPLAVRELGAKIRKRNPLCEWCKTGLVLRPTANLLQGHRTLRLPADRSLDPSLVPQLDYIAEQAPHALGDRHVAHQTSHVPEQLHEVGVARPNSCVERWPDDVENDREHLEARLGGRGLDEAVGAIEEDVRREEAPNQQFAHEADVPQGAALPERLRLLLLPVCSMVALLGRRGRARRLFRGVLQELHAAAVNRLRKGGAAGGAQVPQHVGAQIGVHAGEVAL
mmetsp:Transcript_5877/g.17404  ORF Transcript_5877/g.17404 Transcript_5877/m.17404 type:complete len:331 (+) Transcript_5877:203-1195(+)